MQNFQKLLPLFMVTTALMVIAIHLIVKGKNERQSELKPVYGLLFFVVLLYNK